MVHFAEWRKTGHAHGKSGWGFRVARRGLRHHNMLRVQSKDMAAGRYFRHGKSYAVLIPAHMREQLDWTPNDCVLMCYEHGILWMAKPDKSLIISREKVSKIMDALFPSKDGPRERT